MGRGRLAIPKDERGRFPARHVSGVDPGLVGVRALDHPSVRAWHRWLLEVYEPRFRVALVTPCSNVKPYPLSPTSRKVAGLLRRLGLWNGFAPQGVEWLYLSDLLVFVPYWRAWDYPACCYELHPEEVLGDRRAFERVVGLLAAVVEVLVGRGLERVVLFLPRRHLRIWEEARSLASVWPLEVRVGYTLFSLRPLGEALSTVIGG
ncbi:hypothetical protein [Pyrolobus fumarii]|uniref:hypothetical protein n=1 Tax=Pyrolobus fumarii TaxID=54252 RepID=UPI0014330B0F|nr:hypothetical protein [Pyrolobus fumarii]